MSQEMILVSKKAVKDVLENCGTHVFREYVTTASLPEPDPASSSNPLVRLNYDFQQKPATESQKTIDSPVLLNGVVYQAGTSVDELLKLAAADYEHAVNRELIPNHQVYPGRFVSNDIKIVVRGPARSGVTTLANLVKAGLPLVSSIVTEETDDRVCTFHHREIGEGDWRPCDEQTYEQDAFKPEMDTKTVVVDKVHPTDANSRSYMPNAAYIQEKFGVSQEDIRRIFLAAGFTLKNDHDMKPYVYKAVSDLFAAVKQRDLDLAYDFFNIGSAQRDYKTLALNLKNQGRRADCLDALEQEILGTNTPSWGMEGKAYVDEFKRMLEMFGGGEKMLDTEVARQAILEIISGFDSLEIANILGFDGGPTMAKIRRACDNLKSHLLLARAKAKVES